MTHVNALPKLNRFITTHDEKTGEAIFSNALAEENTFKLVYGDVGFALGYTTKNFPVDFSNDGDVEAYKSTLANPPGLVVSGGTVLRFVDMPPGALSPMHRTVSLDYGVVIEGEVDLVLDSGEERAMKRGDVAIQRGTSHAWRNRSKTEWARMMYVLQESRPFEVNGKRLNENLGDMKGVPSSS